MVSFISIDEARKLVPSAFAESHDGRRSERYNFISTLSIIESMEANNWGLVSAVSPRTRVSLRRDFGIHKLEFQDRETLDIEDPRQVSNFLAPGEKKPIYPRIHIINSHNGTSNLKVMAGLYALVCLNGMVISKGTVGEFNVRHNHRFNAEDAFATINQFRQTLPGVRDVINSWSNIVLPQEKANEFATKAARIRWNKPQDVLPDPNVILQARRVEDARRDFWTIFNRVQENLIRGGFERDNRKVRAISQMREDLRINQELWELGRVYAAEVVQ